MRSWKYVIILANISILVFLLTKYPSFDDFIPGLLSTSQTILNDGFISPDNNTYGYYLMTAMVSITTDLSLPLVASIPLVMLGSVFVIYGILSHITDNENLSFTISFAFLFCSYSPIFYLGLHNLGFILFISSILVLMKNDKGFTTPNMLVLIVLFAATVITSYKYNFIFFTFFIVFFISSQSLGRIKARHYAIFLTLMVIMTIFMTPFLGRTILPMLSSLDILSYFDIFERILHGAEGSVISSFVLSTPLFLKIINFSFLLLISVPLLFLISDIVRTRSNVSGQLGGSVLLSLFVSSVALLFAYAILGKIELLLPILFSILYIGYRYRDNIGNINQMRILSLLLLGIILINIVLLPLSMIVVTQGQRGPTLFEDVKVTSDWAAEHFVDTLYSDVFTYGTMVYRFTETNESCDTKVISSDQAASILVYHNGDGYSYVFNMDLDYIQLMEWTYLISWSENEDDILANNQVVYSSQHIIITKGVR